MLSCVMPASSQGAMIHTPLRGIHNAMTSQSMINSEMWLVNKMRGKMYLNSAELNCK